MQLAQHDVEAVPHQLDGYNIVDNEHAVAYKKIDVVYAAGQSTAIEVVHSYIHFGDNPYTEQLIEDIIKFSSHDKDGFHDNFVAFHSHQYPTVQMTELEKEYSNFRYYYMPLLAFCQIQYHIDFNTPVLPPNSYDRKYSALLNRHTGPRWKLFQHLKQNNLLDQGYVSYRNVARNTGDEQADISEPYRNFDETHYPIELRVNPREFVYHYPVDSFLFDFAIETFLTSESLLLTEKSYKPFYWHKIPLVLGNVGNQHYLESLGFDIFRDIIDHSYDLEKDRDVRIRTYLDQVSAVLALDISTINNLEFRLQKNYDRFCHLVALCDRVLYSIDKNIKHITNNH
jgi:hypothetical protein